MSTERDTTRLVRSWLEEGVTALPDRVLDAVLDQLPTTPQRRSPWVARRSARMNRALRIAVAAAAVVLAVVGGYRLLAPVSNVGPPASASPSPLPSIPVIESPGPLSPGISALDVDGIRVSFEIPTAGWQLNVVDNTIWTSSSEGRFGFDIMDNLYATPCDSDSLREPPLGPTVDALADALVDALAAQPGIDASAPTDVTLGGYRGKLVEISVPRDASPCGGGGVFLWEWTGSTRGEPLSLDDGARTRFWILDAGGTRLVVTAVERDNLQQVWRNQLQGILDSIRIEP